MGKILPLGELVLKIQELKDNGKKIVHCHGVFDLMHPGHIEHLKEAKRLGDILVVIVTLDGYVNKGPGRPVYNEKTRTESIASLDCVDFVALNEVASEAVPVILLLKPHFFVKGQEYEEDLKDSGSLASKEKAAVESYGGTMHFTNQPVFSSSALINSYFPILPERTKSWLSRFKSRYSIADISFCLEAARRLNILLIGDTIIDEYLYCRPIGRSIKEVIPRFQYLRKERFAGGVIAVANHLAGFCDNITLLTVFGRDEADREFVRSKLSKKVTSGFFLWPEVPIVSNKRIVGPTFLEKFFGIYEIDEKPVSSNPELEKQIVASLDNALGSFDLVIVVDYGFGLMTPNIIEAICWGARFLALNVQTNSVNLGFNLITKYPKADFLSASDPEIRLATHKKFEPMGDLLKEISCRQRVKLVTVTLGPGGSISYDGSNFHEVPVFVTKTLDRVGAGDAYFAYSAPQVFLGCDPEVCGFFGNVAGGIAADIVCNSEAVSKEAFLKFAKTLLK